jgi:hypothetical protein
MVLVLMLQERVVLVPLVIVVVDALNETVGAIGAATGAGDGAGAGTGVGVGLGIGAGEGLGLGEDEGPILPEELVLVVLFGLLVVVLL